MPGPSRSSSRSRPASSCFALGKPSLERAVHDAEAHRRHRSRTRRSPTSPAPARSCSRRDEWKPGDKAVYVKFDKYKPRAEPASGLAGGKVVKVDRVEWRAISDHQTGDQRADRRRDRLHRGAAARSAAAAQGATRTSSWSTTTRSATSTPSARTSCTRRSTIRRSARRSGTRSIRRTSSRRSIGDPAYYKTCKAMFVCGTPIATDKGMEGLLESNFQKAQGAPEGSGLRRHAGRAHALDRPRRC